MKYVDSVYRASARAQSEATDSQLRYRLVDFQIKQATAAVQIAAGRDPSINAVGHCGACFAHPCIGRPQLDRSNGQ